jgi:hypothetical protein
MLAINCYKKIDWPSPSCVCVWGGGGLWQVTVPPPTRDLSSLYLFTTPHLSTLTHFASTRLWRWNRHSVPKRRLLNTIRRRTTQKTTHDIQNMAKAWNQGWHLSPLVRRLQQDMKGRQVHCSKHYDGPPGTDSTFQYAKRSIGSVLS